MDDQKKTSLPADPQTSSTGTDPKPVASAMQSPAPMTNGFAIASLIVSILSWFGMYTIGGIVAVICGLVARNQIRESSGRQTGDGIAIAGIVIGAVNIILSCIGILCVLVIFAVSMIGAFNRTGR